MNLPPPFLDLGPVCYHSSSVAFQSVPFVVEPPTYADQVAIPAITLRTVSVTTPLTMPEIDFDTLPERRRKHRKVEATRRSRMQGLMKELKEQTAAAGLMYAVRFGTRVPWQVQGKPGDEDSPDLAYEDILVNATTVLKQYEQALAKPTVPSSSDDIVL